MPDWDQFIRNLVYGAAHRPAQVIRWMGQQFNQEAAPLGSGLILAANDLDTQAQALCLPYVPPRPSLVTISAMPPPAWVYTPAPSIGWPDNMVWEETWNYGTWPGPAGTNQGPGWGYAYAWGSLTPGSWSKQLIPPL